MELGAKSIFSVNTTCEKEMATHSSILALKILWTEEPSGLQSIGSQLDMTNWEHTIPDP